MPLQKLQFRPGVNREGTNYSNEGGFFSCDKIRFRSGYPEKLGGWVNQSTNTFNGVARNLINWVTYDSENLLGIGTSQKYYVEEGGVYNDITPLRTTATLAANPFSVTSGSKVVTVTHNAHGADVGAFVTFSGGTTVAGLDLNNEYEIVKVVNSNSYIITASANASSTTTGGGASVAAAYQLNPQTTTVAAGGWGTGSWSSGTWGYSDSTSVSLPVRLWSHDNYEQDLIFSPFGGTIYYWEKNTTSYPRAVTLQTYSNSLTKGTATALAATTAGNTVLYVDTTDYIDVGAVVTGTNIPTGTYVTSLGNYVPATNSFEVNISAAVTGAGVSVSAVLTFSYSGRATPWKTNYVLSSDTSHFTIALGANPYDPTNFSNTFDPMLVRWSDQDNPYEWTPTSANQSGEQHLSNGSYLVCAQNTRQEILVWSDTAVFSMQYLGPPFVWNFNLIADNVSIISPNAAITINGMTFWMGVDKFYVYTGRVETLPCTLRQFLFTNINRDQFNQVVAGSNESFSEIWWFYPSANSSVNDSYIVYNYLEQLWYYGSLNRTAWLDSPLRSTAQAAYSIQASYLSSAIDASVTSIPLLDVTAYPTTGTVVIDSEEISYTGITGSNLTGCTRGANGTTAASHTQYARVAGKVPNQIMYHENGFDDRSIPLSPQPIVSYIESSDFDIGDGHNFGYVWRILPDLTFDNSSAAAPDCNVKLYLRARTSSGTAYNVGDVPTVYSEIPASTGRYTGEVFTRIRGRQMNFRIESDELGVTWQLGAMRIDIRPDGRR